MSAPRFLLDTNICIYIVKSRPDAVLAKFRRLRQGEAVMSVITYGELQYGAAKSAFARQSRERLVRLASVIPVVDIDVAVAERYGSIRSALDAIGKPIGMNDFWIAAHALALQLTLVTNNEREFRRVPGLKVQNWAEGPGVSPRA